MDKDIYKLCRVEIKGYKSIPFEAPLELTFGDVTVLLGANGSGKSNIISFFISNQKFKVSTLNCPS